MGKKKKLTPEEKFARRKENLKKRNWSLYCLKHSKRNRTYLGVTTNFTNRLRKHNGEIKGGARATRALLKFGKWVPHLEVEGFTKSEALSIERTVKNRWRSGCGKNVLERRVDLIDQELEKYGDTVTVFVYE